MLQYYYLKNELIANDEIICSVMNYLMLHDAYWCVDCLLAWRAARRGTSGTAEQLGDAQELISDVLEHGTKALGKRFQKS